MLMFGADRTLVLLPSPGRARRGTLNVEVIHITVSVSNLKPKIPTLNPKSPEP